MWAKASISPLSRLRGCGGNGAVPQDRPHIHARNNQTGRGHRPRRRLIIARDNPKGAPLVAAPVNAEVNRPGRTAPRWGAGRSWRAQSARRNTSRRPSGRTRCSTRWKRFIARQGPRLSLGLLSGWTGALSSDLAMFQAAGGCVRRRGCPPTPPRARDPPGALGANRRGGVILYYYGNILLLSA